VAIARLSFDLLGDTANNPHYIAARRGYRYRLVAPGVAISVSNPGEIVPSLASIAKRTVDALTQISEPYQLVPTFQIRRSR
jgi:hypothetical protein